MESRVLFLVLGTQRSGTTVTFRLIRGHPAAAGCTDEIHPAALFERGVLCFTRSETVIKPEVRERTYLPKLFEALATANAKPVTMAAGLKTAVGSSEIARKIVELLDGPLRHVRVVLTNRQDWVAEFCSGQRARITGQWHSWSTTTRSAPTKLTVDPREFESYARRVRAVVNELRGLVGSPNTLEIRYERDLVDRPRETATRIFAHLGLTDLDPSWLRSRKVAPPLEDYVTNVAALRKIEADLKSG